LDAEELPEVGGREVSEGRDSRLHAGIARVGVLLIAAGAFRVSYDAWTTVSKASGIRPGLAGYLPWITEGFLALAVYTAWVVRKRGADGKYPVTLAFVLLAVGIYVQVRHGMSHGHPLVLMPVEAGAVSALPTIITAASIHLLVITFEKVVKKAEEKAPEEAAPVIPDTVEELTDNWAKEPAQVEPMPEPVIPEPEVTSPSASRFPEPTAPALRGAGSFQNFHAMASKATDDRTRAYWMNLANAHSKN
jgi:protein-S-isoprenylcysteine O-methyltransferase Ste14